MVPNSLVLELIHDTQSAIFAKQHVQRGPHFDGGGQMTWPSKALNILAMQSGINCSSFVALCRPALVGKTLLLPKSLT